MKSWKVSKQEREGRREQESLFPGVTDLDTRLRDKGGLGMVVSLLFSSEEEEKEGREEEEEEE